MSKLAPSNFFLVGKAGKLPRTALLCPPAATKKMFKFGFELYSSFITTAVRGSHIIHPFKSTENDRHITSHQGVLHTFVATVPHSPVEMSFYISIPPEYDLC